MSRAAGAPLVNGNAVRPLYDASGHFPAMLEMIRAAERSIMLECYIIGDDRVGRAFAEALAERARAGVAVRVLYDWLGSGRWKGRRLWALLAEAGAEVRCYSPPRLDSPFAVLSRDHRKLLTVDGREGVVTGLCLSARWEADPAHRRDEWRDTGLHIRGPALADLEASFAQVWAACGTPLPESAFTPPHAFALVGDVGLRVIPTAPSTAGLYRLDQLVAALARKSLWMADAYFVGVPSYVQALRAAALDGVDVRLLVPGGSDLPLVKQLSRAGYRPLLEAGVRVFEWNGTMLHAKTAVADRHWARVGSTNLNLASWMGNYELDVALEHDGLAWQLADKFEEDLANTTEIVLERRRVQAVAVRRGRTPHRAGHRGRAAAGALRIANTVGAAVANRRTLGSAEAGIPLVMGLALIGLALVGLLWPRWLAFPLALLAAWLGVALLITGKRTLGGSPPGR